MLLNVHLVTALLTKRAGRAGSPTSQLQSRPGSSRLHAVHAGLAPLVTSCPYGLVGAGRRAAASPTGLALCSLVCLVPIITSGSEGE